MTAPFTVALVGTAEAASPDVVELLRVVAALVAAGQPVRLACIGPAHGALDDEELPDEIRDYLDGVADFGVVPADVDAVSVLELLGEARDVLRVAAAGRSGVPALLAIDDPWLEAARADPEEALTAILAAGQVIRAQTERPPDQVGT